MYDEFWNSICVCCYWDRKPTTVGQYVDALSGYLQGLTNWHSLFPKFYLLANGRTTGAVNLSDPTDFSDKVIGALPPWRYRNAEAADFAPHRSSTCRSSYRTSLATAAISAETGAVVAITTGGSDEKGGNAIISIYDKAVQAEDLADIFRFTIRYWSASQGAVGRQCFFRAVGGAVGEPQLGWLTYMSGRLHPGTVPPGAVVEPLDAGSLIRLSREVRSDDASDLIRWLQEFRLTLASASQTSRN